MGCLGMFANIQGLNNFLQTSVVFILVFLVMGSFKNFVIVCKLLYFSFLYFLFWVLTTKLRIFCQKGRNEKYKNEKRQYVSKIQLDSHLGKMKNTRMKMGRLFKYCVFLGFSRHLISLFCQVHKVAKIDY